MNVRAARGAIVVAEDERATLLAATAKLVGQMIERNGLQTKDIVSVLFTTTPDLRSAFPAEAAREIGLTSVPLLCAQEIDVEGAMPRVIRVLMHFETGAAQGDVEHVYLDGAEVLRDDLP